MAVQYFDWYQLFVNELAGGPAYFIALSIVAIAIIGVYFRMQPKTLFIMGVTFIMMFTSLTSSYWYFFVFISGIFWYWLFKKAFHKTP